jgi:hypothetical protein
MNKQNSNADEARLGALLRDARATPSLPPRFQENVWRRIESADACSIALEDGNWFDAWMDWVLRPRLAFAVVAVLVMTGVGLGWSRGEQLARQDAQARYLMAVAPNSLR